MVWLSARAKAGLTTIVSPNKAFDKGRTSIAERFVQTVRGIQKTLINQVEDQIEATIPAGHPLIQWAAMHSAWLYDRNHVHTTMKVTPYQSLHGRPYQGRLVCFGKTVYGLDPKATKFKPAWRKGAWIGKDSASMDLIATDGLCIICTKAMRKVSDQWDADLLIGMTDGPMDFFGHRQVKARQKIVALSAPIAQEVDEDAEAVRDLPLSEGYSASEPLDDDELKLRQDLVEGQAWEDVGLEQFSEAGGQLQTPDTGGPTSPGMMAPVTPQMGVPSDHKINTKLNPGDMNAKRLGGERRKFLSRLMSLFCANADEENDDKTVRQIRRVNMATRRQCIRLIQVAGTAMGVCLQLKGCMKDDSEHLEPAAGGNVPEPYSDWQLAWWMFVDWCFATFGDVTAGLVMVLQGPIFYAVQLAGIGVLAVAGAFFLAGPLFWRHYFFLRGFALRNAPWLMGIRFRFIKMALWAWIVAFEGGNHVPPQSLQRVQGKVEI